jgi:hypothetical protein
LKELGRQLYDTLFATQNQNISNEFYACYKNFREGRDHRLRISLIINNPYAQSLPWELLHDQECYLGPDSKVSIIRRTRGVPKMKPKQIRGTLKVLIIISNPKGEGELAYANKEKDEIKEKLESAFKEKVSIDILSSELADDDIPTMKNIIKKLEARDYNIIHYIGHSHFNGRKGYIFLGKSEGGIKRVSDDYFANRPDPKRTTDLGLIVLNSCQSGVERGFNGIAKRIMEKKKIPCVISMQFNILDKTGAEFSSEFYGNFVKDYAPEDAINLARENLLAEKGMEFAAPVVYMSTNGKTILRGINRHDDFARVTIASQRKKVIPSPTPALEASSTYRQPDSKILREQIKTICTIYENDLLSIPPNKTPEEFWQGSPSPNSNSICLKTLLFNLQKNQEPYDYKQVTKKNIDGWITDIPNLFTSLSDASIQSEKDYYRKQIFRKFGEVVTELGHLM